LGSNKSNGSEGSDESTTLKIIKTEGLLGYKFKDKDILKRALTRTAYNNDHNRYDSLDQEPLATIGDAVIGFLVIKCLTANGVKTPRDITERKKDLVSREHLSGFSRSKCLQECVLWGKGEGRDKIWEKRRALGECLEAIVGAVYLDSKEIDDCEMVLEKFLPRNCLE